MLVNITCINSEEQWEFPHNTLVYWKVSNERQVTLYFSNGMEETFWLENANAILRFIIALRAAVQNAVVMNTCVKIAQYEPPFKEENPELLKL